MEGSGGGDQGGLWGWAGCFPSKGGGGPYLQPHPLIIKLIGAFRDESTLNSTALEHKEVEMGEQPGRANKRALKETNTDEEIERMQFRPPESARSSKNEEKNCLLLTDGSKLSKHVFKCMSCLHYCKRCFHERTPSLLWTLSSSSDPALADPLCPAYHFHTNLAGVFRIQGIQFLF